MKEEKNVRRLLVFMWVTGAWRESPAVGVIERRRDQTQNALPVPIYTYTHIYTS
jgi:hypothetical protein